VIIWYGGQQLDFNILLAKMYQMVPEHYITY